MSQWVGFLNPQNDLVYRSAGRRLAGRWDCAADEGLSAASLQGLGAAGQRLYDEWRVKLRKQQNLILVVTLLALFFSLMYFL